MVPFSACGVPNIVVKFVTGALAEPASLSAANRWVLDDSPADSIAAAAEAPAEPLRLSEWVARLYS